MERDSKNNNPESSESNYGSGYHDYSTSGTDVGGQRSIQDYLLIIRERFIWIIVILILVMVVTTVVTINQTPLYKSVATLEVKRKIDQVINIAAVDDQNIINDKDFNTEVKILESTRIISQVAERLKGDDKNRFMEPYLKGENPEDVSLASILYENRTIIPQRLTLIVAVEYVHPNPEIAAKVANMFVDEYIGFNQRTQLEASLKARVDLEKQAEQQRLKLEVMEIELQEYREEHKTVSFDERFTVENDKRRVLNNNLTEAEIMVNEAESQWSLIDQYRNEGKSLNDLSFIADNALVQKLSMDVSTLKIEVARLSQRYREKHPTMISSKRSLEEVELELDRAIRSEVEKRYSDLLRARTRFEKSQVVVEAQKIVLLRLKSLSGDYERKKSDVILSREFYLSLQQRIREMSITSTLENANAQALDRANPGLEPYWPNYILFFGAGAFGGGMLGLGVAFIIAFLDDRVKSAHDIENVVKVPLLGVISEVKNLQKQEKAKIVNSRMENQASEGFRALHSSLRLNSDSKEAQCLMVTSTIPGEGKSFVSTNLAFTFATHGERTLLIDCDLRLPNIAKSLMMKNELGVIDYCYEKVTFDEIIQHDETSGLDVISSGGRATNPSQILSSHKFAEFMQEARSKYSRIIIDTPPISAVSDSLLVLPLTDGVIYTIKFNAVKRKAAALNIRRLKDSSVPVFGAVLNNLKLAVSGYYYSYQYHKYQDYHYHKSAPTDGSGKLPES